jgi:hypothetical protein
MPEKALTILIGKTLWHLHPDGEYHLTPPRTTGEPNSDNSGLGSSKSEHIPQAALVKSPQGEVHRMGALKPSHSVKITCFRINLLDRDNKWACVKALVDGIVEAGFIRGDSESEIDLSVSQEKVSSHSEIKTIIQIDPL